MIDFKLITPLKIIVHEEIKKITFKGLEGYVTILPNHIDYISVFQPHIITFVNNQNIEKYVSVLSGSLVKVEKKIRISTQEAIISDNIIGLQKINLEDDLIKNINKNLNEIGKYITNKFF